MTKTEEVPTRSEYSGRLIIQNSQKNPRHVDTHGYQSFKIVMDAGGKIRYEEYKARGGRPQDLRWDLQHGYLRLGPPRRTLSAFKFK